MDEKRDGLHSMDRWAIRGGVNRVIALQLALICIMLVIIAVPFWRQYQNRAATLACAQAMDSAGDGLIIEYLNRWEGSSVEDAMVTLDEVMPGRPELCPSKGTIYLVKNSQDIYEPYCGLHDPDLKRRVRLNASRAMELADEARQAVKKEKKAEPDSVTIQLNGKPLTCVRVQAEEKLRRGTSTTDGYDGVVAFYGLNGDGSFKTKKVGAGKMCYFIYADENYYAVWRADDGWTGDAYKE